MTAAAPHGGLLQIPSPVGHQLIYSWIGRARTFYSCGTVVGTGTALERISMCFG